MGDHVRRPARGRTAVIRGRAAAWRPFAAVLTACLWAPGALAFAPIDALTSTPDSERTLRQAAAVDAAERALGASRTGTDLTLSARPAVRYGADVEDPAALGASVDLELDLAWRYDRAAVLADGADLLLARERLRHDRRSDVLRALRLHAKVLRAEVALHRAQLDLTRARRMARTARAASDTAPTSPALLRAEAVADARRHALDALRRQAEHLRFAGDARFIPVRFVLPTPGATSPRRPRLLLELQRTRAERDEVSFDVLRDVTLSATYESRSLGYQVSASLSLDRGRPAADLNGQLGAQQDDQWSLELGARLRLDAAGEAARSAAEERVRRARAALEALDRSYRGDVANARTAVDDAASLLGAELAAWREAAATPAISASACRQLLARENAVYGAWLDVLSATFDYLELVDVSWRAAPDPFAPDAFAPDGIGGAWAGQRGRGDGRRHAEGRWAPPLLARAAERLRRRARSGPSVRTLRPPAIGPRPRSGTALRSAQLLRTKISSSSARWVKRSARSMRLWAVASRNASTSTRAPRCWASSSMGTKSPSPEPSTSTST